MMNARLKSGLYALLAGMGLLLGACNSSTDGGGDPVSKEQLVGKWILTSFRYNVTNTLTPPDPEFPNTTTDTTLNLAGSGNYQNLKADGTYESVLPSLAFLGGLEKSAGSKAEDDGVPGEGTWTVSGNLLTTVSTDGDTAVFATVLDGASGTFTQSLNESFSFGDNTYTQKGAITVKATKQ